VTEDAIEDLRRWTGLEADTPFTTWHDLKKQHACQAPCDYIPRRSYPLLQAREVLRLLAEEGIEGSGLAEAYHLNRHTVAKWRQRKGVEDASHRPQRLHATLSAAQEAVVVALRETLPPPLDDLLAVTREFIHPEVSRSGLDCCLRRHGVSNLKR